MVVLLAGCTTPIRSDYPAKVAEMKKAFRFEAMQAGLDEPHVAVISPTNLLDEDLTFEILWDPPEGNKLAVFPMTTDVKLRPGESRQISFKADRHLANAEPPWCWCRMLMNGKAIDEGRANIAVYKVGYYFDGNEPPPKETELRIDSVSQVVLWRNNWKGIADCSATGWLMRNDKGLTFRAEVNDDTLIVTNARPWENDGVEIFMDTRPECSRGTSSYGKGVFQAIATPASGTNPASIAFFPDRETSAVSGATVTSDILPGRGYSIEVFLPFDGFTTNHFKPGDQFNFSFGVDDADQGKRKDQLMWSGSSHNGFDAAAFGRMSPFVKQ